MDQRRRLAGLAARSGLVLAIPADQRTPEELLTGQLWSLDSGKPLRTFGKHEPYYNAHALSPDGRFGGVTMSRFAGSAGGGFLWAASAFRNCLSSCLSSF